MKVDKQKTNKGKSLKIVSQMYDKTKQMKKKK